MIFILLRVKCFYKKCNYKSAEFGHVRTHCKNVHHIKNPILNKDYGHIEGADDEWENNRRYRDNNKESKTYGNIIYFIRKNKLKNEIDKNNLERQKKIIKREEDIKYERCIICNNNNWDIDSNGMNMKLSNINFIL
jgi:hypothetical protein